MSAYVEWRRIDRLNREYESARKALLEAVQAGLDEVPGLIFRLLTSDRAARKVLVAFTGHTKYGWEVACGCDRRIARLAEKLEWNKFYTIVIRAKKELGYI